MESNYSKNIRSYDLIIPWNQIFPERYSSLREIEELSDWLKQSTSKDSIILSNIDYIRALSERSVLGSNSTPLRIGKFTIWLDNKLLYENFIENEKMNEPDMDGERKQIVKKIKLESNFYNVFRNTLRIILNLNENKEKKREILSLIEDKRIKYYTKLDLLKEKIEKLMSDYIDFGIIDIENIDEIIKCFGLDDESSCGKNKCCSFSKKTGKCQLVLPLKNMITDTDNQIYYYIKVTDEILRYKKIRNFFFDRQTFLSFGKIHYNLKDDEIILLEDLLLNKYFNDIKPLKKSAFINSARTFDYSNADKSIEYTDRFSIEKEDRDILNSCFMGDDEVSDTWKEERVGQKWRELGLGRRGKENADFSFLRVRDTNDCLWKTFIEIVKDFKKENITKNELLNILIEAYDEYFKAGYEETIKKIFIKQLKKEIVSQLKNGIDLNLVFTMDNYWLTSLDIFILSIKLGIPIVLFSSKKTIPSLFSKTCVFGDGIRTTGASYFLKRVKTIRSPHRSPIFGILTYKNEIKIDHSEIKDGAAELLFKIQLKTIDDYTNRFIVNTKIAAQRKKKLKKKTKL